MAASSALVSVRTSLIKTRGPDDDDEPDVEDRDEDRAGQLASGNSLLASALKSFFLFAITRCL